MPLIGRRRPLMRAAMVGGAGYAVGKRRAAGQQAEQDAAIAQQPAPAAPAPRRRAVAPPPAPAAPAPAPPAAAPALPAMSDADRIEALKNLKELLDSGV